MTRRDGEGRMKPETTERQRRDNTKADEHWAKLAASLREMEGTRGSAVAMCHEQGKTAVYWDGDDVVEVPPR